MKQNKVYPYGKKGDVVSIVGGSIIFATSSTSSTLISGVRPQNAPANNPTFTLMDVCKLSN